MNSDFPEGFAPQSCLVPDNMTALAAAWYLSLEGPRVRAVVRILGGSWGGGLATGRHWDFYSNKTDIVEFPNDVQSRSTGVLPLPEPPSTKPASVSWRWGQPDLPLKLPPASFKH